MSSIGSSRPRVSHACRQCKRRKLKCDLGRPACGRCAATSDPQCEYEVDIPAIPNYQYVAGPSTASDNRRLKRGSEDLSEGITIPLERLESIEGRLQKLTGLVHALQASISIDTIPSRSRGIEHSSTRQVYDSTSCDVGVSTVAGHLDVQAGGQARYVSRSHWAAICDEATEIETLLHGQTRYENDITFANGRALASTLVSAPPAWHVSHRSSSKFRQPTPFSMLQLPDRTCCDVLFESFVSNYHPAVPLVHVPTFRKEYRSFVDFKGSSKGQTISTPPLILASLYAGAVALPNSTVRNAVQISDRQALATDLYHEATKALLRAHFPRVPTVGTLGAYLIVQGTWMRDEEPLTTCGFIGVAIRVAQMLGLHRDPSHFKATISPVNAEVCRRVWWHVFHVDVLVAMASGLPPLIERGSWDTAMVSELYEEHIGWLPETSTDNTTEESPRPTSPLGIWLRGKFEETLLVRDLLNNAFAHESVTIQEMRSMREELETLTWLTAQRANRIPVNPSIDTYENNTRLNLWSKILLSSLGDKNWWFLHSPLLSRVTSQAWPDLVPTVERHCCMYLSKFVILACAPEFTGFQWAWPGNHQPLHALMMLLKEVDKNPYSIGADSVRTVIDQAIALCGPEGGITSEEQGKLVPRPLTEGGSEAWSLIQRLRARAWHKVGLDPDIRATREEVYRIVQSRLEAFKSGQPIDLVLSDPIEEQYAGRSPSSTLPEALIDPYSNTVTSDGSDPPYVDWEAWEALFGTLEP